MFVYKTISTTLSMYIQRDSLRVVTGRISLTVCLRAKGRKIVLISMIYEIFSNFRKIA